MKHDPPAITRSLDLYSGSESTVGSDLYLSACWRRLQGDIIVATVSPTNWMVADSNLKLETRIDGESFLF